MKKLLFFALLLQGVFGMAQEIGYGIIGGLNITSVRTDLTDYWDIYSVKPIVSGYIGGYACMPVSKGKLFAEAEISGIGAKFQDDEATIDENLSFKVTGTMLQIPVYYEYDLTDKIALDGGAYVGAILNMKGNTGGKVNTNTLDAGLLAGVKYHLNDKLSLVARYNFGLLDVDATKIDIETSYYKEKLYDPKNRNSIFQIGVAYRLK